MQISLQYCICTVGGAFSPIQCFLLSCSYPIQVNVKLEEQNFGYFTVNCRLDEIIFQCIYGRKFHETKYIPYSALCVSCRSATLAKYWDSHRCSLSQYFPSELQIYSCVYKYKQSLTPPFHPWHGGESMTLTLMNWLTL